MAEKYAILREERDAAAGASILLTEPLDHLYWGLLIFRLPAQAHERLTERLGLRGAVQRMSKDLARIHDSLSVLQRIDLLPSQVVSVLDRVGEPSVAVARIACAEMPVVVHWLDLYQSSLRHVRSDIDGNDLLALGVPRGPLYSNILTALRSARLDGLTRDREQELALAMHLTGERLGPPAR